MNEPIRTIVLDDKPLIRKAIVQHVDWQALGCLVVGEAGNGLDGIRLIDQCKPDLMVTDIRMPGCDGLELADYMKRTAPSSRVILITGHQEFEYARRAVSLGAFEFILKPICYTELQRVIAKAAEELLRQRREEAERLRALQAREDYERDLLEAIPFLRSKLVADYIAGQSMKGGGLTGRAELLEFEWFMLAHCRLPKPADMPDSGQAVAAASREWIEASLAAGVEAAIAAVGDDLVLALMLRRSGFDTEELAREAAMASAGKWKEMILGIAGQQGGIIALSSLYSSPSQLREAFAETSRKLEACFFAGFSPEPSPAVSYKRLSVDADREARRESMQLPGSLLTAFREKSSLEQEHQIRNLLEQIAVIADGNIAIAKSLVAEACFGISRLYMEHAHGEQRHGRTAEEIMNAVQKHHNLEECYRYMCSYAEEMRDCYGCSPAGYSHNVRRAVEFIRSHYAKLLNLSVVARELDVNPSYLSRILSQETGSSFVELVATARIEAAKRLLKEGQYRVNEVSELVGYKDYNYFYQIFKKYTGMAPTDYKKEKKDDHP